MNGSFHTGPGSPEAAFGFDGSGCLLLCVIHGQVREGGRVFVSNEHNSKRMLGPPVGPFYPFWGRVPLLKYPTEKKGTLILASLPEDLVCKRCTCNLHAGATCFGPAKARVRCLRGSLWSWTPCRERPCGSIGTSNEFLYWGWAISRTEARGNDGLSTNPQVSETHQSRQSHQSIGQG